MKITLTKLSLYSLIAFSSCCYALKEKDYQVAYCWGRMEYRLQDKTRVDCLTSSHAVEFDFGRKWAEAIGQSLGYAMLTGKKAGIVLILKRPKSEKYWEKLNSVIAEYNLPIDTWKIAAWKEAVYEKTKK